METQEKTQEVVEKSQEAEPTEEGSFSTTKSPKKSLTKKKKKKLKFSVRQFEKNNYFTRQGISSVDYKNTKILSLFLNKQGQIIPKTLAKLPSKIQRLIAKNIKRARQIKLLPYSIIKQGEF